MKAFPYSCHLVILVVLRITIRQFPFSTIMNVVAVVAILATCVGAITFHLPASVHKCIQEDVHKDVLVVGNYEISPSDFTVVNLDVKAGCSLLTRRLRTPEDTLCTTKKMH